MNLFGNRRLIQKVVRSFDKYLLTTYSAVPKSFDSRRDEQLQTRLLNFLERTETIDKNGKATSIDSHKFQSLADDIGLRNDFGLGDMEFEALVKSIQTLQQPRQDSSKISLSVIDDSCCKILSKLSQSEVLRLLHLLTRARPQDVPFLKFYKHSLNALRKLLRSRKLTTQEALQLLFFEGLRKKLAVRNVKFVIEYLPPMSDLSIMEQCIVAHTAFKCRVKLQDTKLLEEVIEENADTLVKDPAILVTFCKALRYAGPLDNCLLQNLSEAILNNEEIFSLKCTAHTLSLYAEAKLECSEVLQRLFDDAMKDLIEQRITHKKLDNPAEKDVDRLLWASSILNYKLRSSDMQEISSFIDRRYWRLAKKPFLFANMLLSLWILKFRLKEVVIRCLEENVFLPVLEDEKLWKPIARLQLLLSCVRIEDSDIKLPDEIVRPYKVGMKIRGSVKKLKVMIDILVEKFEINKVIIDCPVDGIYIPGVSFMIREKSFHADLLDESTCFKATNIPHGLMNLKLRLLSQIGICSILMTKEQLNDAEIFSLTIERCIKNNQQ